MSKPFRHPRTIPRARGLYMRDWRGTDIEPASERRLMVDLWEPIDDPDEFLYPGCWYVTPRWNDANEQRLPWRPLTWIETVQFRFKHPAEWYEFRRGEL